MAQNEFRQQRDLWNKFMHYELASDGDASDCAVSVRTAQSQYELLSLSTNCAVSVRTAQSQYELLSQYELRSLSTNCAVSVRTHTETHCMYLHKFNAMLKEF